MEKMGDEEKAERYGEMVGELPEVSGLFMEKGIGNFERSSNRPIFATASR
jgi:hypothetical protein